MIIPFNPVVSRKSTITDKILCFLGQHDWVTRAGSGLGSLYYQCKREHCKKFRIWSSRFGWIDFHKSGEINVRMILDRKMEINKEKWDLSGTHQILPEEWGKIPSPFASQRLKELVEMEKTYDKLYEEYKMEIHGSVPSARNDNE